MLLSLSLENWMSFKDKVTFSMIASRERQHGDRVTKLDKYQTRILPIATLYGANASGKTNFFKALSFAKSLIVTGTKTDALIPVEPFKLDSTMLTRPTSFIFELLIDQDIYEFSFSVTRKRVVEEQLTFISSTSERVLYHRKKDLIELDKSLDKDLFLDFVFRGTRENQLYLTNTVSQKVDMFKAVYDWFDDTLELIAPDSRFEPFDQFFDKNHKLYPTMNEALTYLDTGISRLGSENISFEHLPISEALKIKLQEDLKENSSVRLIGGPNNDRFIITRKDDILYASKLVTYHRNSDNNTETKFEMHQESDGTQRIIDLLPTFLDLFTQNRPKVYVIDEIGRSLHTLLIRKLIESYLSKCSNNSRTQLLFTTHDVLLFDQKLLRRDEMWVSERNDDGISHLRSLSNYKDIRYDKDIRKSYLQGRLGGIPRMFVGELPSPFYGKID